MSTTSSGKRVYVKLHETTMGILIAACDEELIGRVLEEPEKNLRVHITPSFYMGELKTTQELLELLKSADMANIVGEEAVKVALTSGLVHPNAVLRVSGVPIAYFTRI
ncbi:MAG: DUF424 family protein [Desulfurococcaceae archaeon]